MWEKHPDTCVVVLDSLNERILEFRKSMLINQISRDADKIAKSFDALHSDVLEKLSVQFSHCSAIIATGLIKIEQEEDDLRMACAELHGCRSLSASRRIRSTARAGHPLRH